SSSDNLRSSACSFRMAAASSFFTLSSFCFLRSRTDWSLNMNLAIILSCGVFQDLVRSGDQRCVCRSSEDFLQHVDDLIETEAFLRRLLDEAKYPVYQAYGMLDLFVAAIHICSYVYQVLSVPVYGKGFLDPGGSFLVTVSDDIGHDTAHAGKYVDGRVLVPVGKRTRKHDVAVKYAPCCIRYRF